MEKSRSTCYVLRTGKWRSRVGKSLVQGHLGDPDSQSGPDSVPTVLRAGALVSYGLCVVSFTSRMTRGTFLIS